MASLVDDGDLRGGQLQKARLQHLDAQAIDLQVRLGIEVPQLLADLARANRGLRSSYPG